MTYLYCTLGSIPKLSRLKPTWDKLAQDYGDRLLVADVDCASTAKPLCDRYKVQGFPTLRWWSPPDRDGDDYGGERDYLALSEFANAIKPQCTLSVTAHCTTEELEELQQYTVLSDDERGNSCGGSAERSNGCNGSTTICPDACGTSWRPRGR